MSLKSYLEKKLGTVAVPQLDMLGKPDSQLFSEKRFRLPLHPGRLDLDENRLKKLIVSYYESNACLVDIPTSIIVNNSPISYIPEVCFPKRFVSCDYDGKKASFSIHYMGETCAGFTEDFLQTPDPRP